MKNTPGDKGFFMGKVTASVSHELQNVLAIIRETAGLMQDFMMMDYCPDLEMRLENSLMSIKNQVTRGVNLTSGLNAFAHTADFASCTVDVHDTLSRLLYLIERISRNKGFSVELVNGTACSLTCDPVLFQTLNFMCLETLFSTLPSGQSIRVSVTRHGNGICIEYSCPDFLKTPQTDFNQSAFWTDLEKACQCARVSLTTLENTAGIALIFV